MGQNDTVKHLYRIAHQLRMDVVEMILSGKVNKRLVRLFQACGLPAVGQDLFTASSYPRLQEMGVDQMGNDLILWGSLDSSV